MVTDGQTDGRTDERTLVVVESLSRLKTNILENLESDLVYKSLVWIEDFDLFYVILRLYLKKKV